MRVKCLVQEHNVVPRSVLEPGPPDPESSALTIISKQKMPVVLAHEKNKIFFLPSTFIRLPGYLHLTAGEPNEFYNPIS